MPRIIATDEAGYGPRLGPLVVAASIWDIDAAAESSESEFPGTDGQSASQRRFEALADGCLLPDGRRMAINDSKQVFKRHQVDGLGPLELAVAVFAGLQRSAAATPVPDTRASTLPADLPTNLEECLRWLAPGDAVDLAAQVWFRHLDVPFPVCASVSAPTPLESRQLRSQLAEAGIAFTGATARVLDAEKFNALCHQAGNKATVLSETTIALVHSSIEASDPDEPIEVFSDRHGGRRRYAALLQQCFPDSLPRILCESPLESRYRFVHRGVQVDWRFTVKGDSFPPVALASMFAKYLRERLMERFNAFWMAEHPLPLVPTAGYYNDAQRFCEGIASTAQRLAISEGRYIRRW